MEPTRRPTPFAFPVFVVWKSTTNEDSSICRKTGVVVDLRGLNAISVMDSYSLPLQDDFLAEIRSKPFISIFDGLTFFYQWLVKEEDRAYVSFRVLPALQP